MPSYLIAFDLKKAGSDYAGLMEAVRKYPSFVQLSRTTFAVETGDSPEQLFEALEKHLDRYDFCYILQLGRGLAGRGSEKATRWLQSHI